MWWIHATNNKESKSRVICKTRQKPYLERKLSNHLSSLLFHSKLPLFLFKTSIFLLKLSSATFSLFQNCQVCYFFIENYQVCHFHTKLFGFSLFQLTLSSTLLLPFFNSDGLATFPFKTVDFVTLIWSSLLLFYWKRSSSLLFVRNCRVCYSGIFRHTGILGLRMREFDAGLWTLDSGRWTLDTGLWTLDSGLWALDSGLWTLDTGLWMLDSGVWRLDSGRWTLDAEDAGSKTVDSRHWLLDSGR